MIDLSNAVILDTETTGLGNEAEIVEIGIIQADSGAVLMEALMRPLSPIPAAASAVHGIEDSDVANAATWPELAAKFVSIVRAKNILIYNSSYDCRIIRNTTEMHLNSGEVDLLQIQSLEKIAALISNCYCVMKYYSEFMAQRSGRREKWRKLTKAAEEQGVQFDDLNAHRAVSDCEITRRLLLAIQAKATV